jgi:DNA mismatch repair protein MutS
MTGSSGTHSARRDGHDTPIRRQYEHLKAQHPDCILLFQLGDFFESFEADARTVAQVCGVTLTSREFGKGDRVALAGVPITRLEHYLARLMEAGIHVAVAEQVSPPGSGLVERVVTRVVTPGTLAEPGLLREKENTYLAAVVRGRSGLGLAYVDVSTGEFAVTQFDGEDAEARLRAELERLDPAELLAPEVQEPELPRKGHLTVCQRWRFDEAASRDRLCSHFGVLSLDGFGCAGLPLAIGAAGAILAYLEENNRRLLPNLTGLRTYSAAGGMALDGYTRRNLELLRNGRTGRVEGSLLSILDHTRTAMGGRLLRRWLGQPLLDLPEINQRLDSVEALVQADSLRGQVRSLLARIGDLERQVGRISQGLAGPRELLDLAESLQAVALVREAVTRRHADGVRDGHGGVERQGPADEVNVGRTDAATWGHGEGLERAFSALPHLPFPASDLDPCPEVVDLISRAVARPGSGRTIRPGYSAELDSLVGSIGQARHWIAELERGERQRTGIRSLKVGYNKVFGYYLEVTRPNLAHVPPDYRRKQTLVAAERFITPELKDREAQILNAEERVQELEREEFDGLLRQIAAHGPRLRSLARALGHLDVFSALAQVARDRGYCRPVLDEGDAIRIVDGRHPVVEASLEPGTFIPNDCRLGCEDCQVIVITGPNMAGKSTYLRQVALIVLLAQAGSFVPAREARIGLVDRLFTRVGAQDDIAAGASTFMVEMMEAAQILRHATARSLIVLDEIGRGTSTFDGLSIARAVVEEVHQRIGARTLCATHFHELAESATELPRVQVFNAAVAEERGEVIFLRKIVPGAADQSYGIHVARLAGLPDTVTRRAEEILRELEAPGTRGRADAQTRGERGEGTWRSGDAELRRLSIDEGAKWRMREPGGTGYREEERGRDNPGNIRSYRELRVYQSAMDCAMEIFEATRTFPMEERYSMVDQMRRSSRAVCANIAEAWRKRRYPAHFASKLSDAESEAEETRVWLEFAFRCGYMNESNSKRLEATYHAILGQLVRMASEPEKWKIR